MSQRSLSAAIIVTALCFSGTAFAQSFSGAFEFAWLDTPDGNHRDMRVLKTVKFIDAGNKTWTVPSRSTINGASIPRILWTFAGSPFVGKYRRASVIHDYYCDIRTELQSKVHSMFKEAMIADGASWLEANSKYAAVKFAGLCPEKKGVIASKHDTLAKSNFGRFGQNTINQLGAAKRDNETSGQKYERDREAIQSALKPAEQQVFDRLLALKDAETENNLKALESVLQEFRLEDQQYEDLVTLVETIYPSDFK